MSIRSRAKLKFLSQMLQNLTQWNGGKYTKNQQNRSLQRECRVLPSFQEQGGLWKNKHQALPFLAAISVRKKGWKLDQTWQPIVLY